MTIKTPPQPIVRVLVVDDDPFQLELIGRALSHDGFEVSCLSSPSNIAEDVRRLAPDFVLLDVNMPGGPGGLALELARKAAPPGVRFLLFSASDESTLRALATKFRADGYLSKSWPATEIAKRLRVMRLGRPSSPGEDPPRSR